MPIQAQIQPLEICAQAYLFFQPAVFGGPAVAADSSEDTNMFQVRQRQTPQMGSGISTAQNKGKKLRNKWTHKSI